MILRASTAHTHQVSTLGIFRAAVATPSPAGSQLASLWGGWRAATAAAAAFRTTARPPGRCTSPALALPPAKNLQFSSHPQGQGLHFRAWGPIPGPAAPWCACPRPPCAHGRPPEAGGAAGRRGRAARARAAAVGAAGVHRMRGRGGRGGGRRARARRRRADRACGGGRRRWKRPPGRAPFPAAAPPLSHSPGEPFNPLTATQPAHPPHAQGAARHGPRGGRASRPAPAPGRPRGGRQEAPVAPSPPRHSAAQQRGRLEPGAGAAAAAARPPGVGLPRVLAAGAAVWQCRRLDAGQPAGAGGGRADLGGLGADGGGRDCAAAA
jgi:hypothetical protein